MRGNTKEIAKYELFDEMTRHLLEDDKPSYYINKQAGEGGLAEHPFSMLLKQKDTQQEPKHHPEGNVWKHTMLVVDEAAKVRVRSNEPKVFMWAALLHDIGKPDTTKRRGGKLTSYDHDKVGERLAAEFLEQCLKDREFIKSVAVLVRYHMHILYVLKNLPYADMKGLLRSVDVNELALLCLCDRLGRGKADEKAEHQHYEAFRAVLLQKRELLMFHQ